MNATKDHPLTGKHAELFETWLRPNGIVGWMPENPRIVVDVTSGTVTWPQWRHETGDGPWGKNVVVKSDAWADSERRTRNSDEDGPVIDQRTVPLVEPVTDQVRALCRGLGVELVEQYR